MSLPPPDLATTLARLADELAGLRHSVDAIGRQLTQLTGENAALRERLAQSETARADLTAQTEHIVELLADSRRELRAVQQKPG